MKLRLLRISTALTTPRALFLATVLLAFLLGVAADQALEQLPCLTVRP